MFALAPRGYQYFTSYCIGDFVDSLVFLGREGDNARTIADTHVYRRSHSEL